MTKPEADYLVIDDDLAPKQIPIRVYRVEYIVIEAPVDAAIKYRNANSKSLKLDDGKITRLEGMADSEVLLTSMCCIKTNDDGTMKLGNNKQPVSTEQQTIRTWRHATLKKVYNWIRENSDLVEGDTEEQLVKLIENATKKLAKIREGQQSGPKASADGSPNDGTES